MHSKFFRHFILSLVVGFLVITSTYLIIDPLGILDMPLITGLNHVKSNSKFERYIKANQLKKTKPKSIVFGTSRSGYLYDIHSTNYLTELSPYDCSFGGASFNEIFDFFEYSLSIQPDVKNIIIGIDLFSFGKKRRYISDFTIAKFQEIQNPIIQTYTNVLSWNVFKSSLLTIKESFSCCIFETNPTSNNPIISLGENKFFENVLDDETWYYNYTIDDEKIEQLRTVVNTCRQKGITLTLFICPVKAMYWEFYYQNGLWPSVEKLKRDIVTIYPLWDFSGFTPLTTESLDTNGNPLYQECSHFTPFAGQFLIQQMFNGPETSSLGCLLTPQNIDAHLEKILEDRKEWLKGPGKEINVKF